jgi:hypothetical protein
MVEGQLQDTAGAFVIGRLRRLSPLDSRSPVSVASPTPLPAANQVPRFQFSTFISKVAYFTPGDSERRSVSRALVAEWRIMIVPLLTEPIIRTLAVAESLRDVSNSRPIPWNRQHHCPRDLSRDFWRNHSVLQNMRASLVLGEDSRQYGDHASAKMQSSLRCASHGTWQISIRPNDYLSSFGVTSLSSPVDKSKTNPRIITFDGIHGCDLSFSTCFCVARFTSE